MDAPAASVFHCAACSALLAYDQRYCLECGTRRGPVPAQVAALIAGIFEQGRGITKAGPSHGEEVLQAPRWVDDLLRAPRAAAAAVMGMLGFGALVGSMAGGGVANPLETLLVSVSPVAHASRSAADLAAQQDPGGPQTITVQDTITSGGFAGSAGLAGGGLSSGGGGGGGGSTGTTPSTSNLPPIKHVFMIVLSGQGYQQTFGHSTNDPYLASTLARKGELVPNYYAVAGSSLANEIALISGQGPTAETQSNCPRYRNIVPGRKAARQQVLGHGCVYPKSTSLLASQLTEAKKTWKVYVQMAGSPKQARSVTCAPKPGSSPSMNPSAKAPYAGWRNPFLYFRAVLGRSACPKSIVSLSGLARDLKSAETTPALSYIVPDLCDDGSGFVCDPHGPVGLAASDAFLKSVVPLIERSPAYKADGMIAVTFDQAPQSGPNADSSSCCGNPKYPNLPPPSATPTSTGTSTGTPTVVTATSPTATSPVVTVPATTPPTTTPGTTTSPSTTPTATTPAGTAPGLGSGQTSPTGGGGQVGLLVLSRYVTPGTQDVTDYLNHYSLLAGIEQLFGLKRLGYALDPNLPVFGPALFSAYTGA